MKPSPPANDNLAERTCRLWKRRLGRDLSREEARQFAENVSGFFALLAEWSRAERLAAAPTPVVGACGMRPCGFAGCVPGKLDLRRLR
jgi:hypothetical protein